MTKYPISSSNSETELTEWEARMEKLVGLSESTPTDIDDAREQSQASLPSESVTQQPLSANPFAKAGLVGAATLGVVMFAGGFLSQIMSNDKPKPQADKIVTQTPPQPQTKPRLQQLSEEVESLKTKLALSEQLETVKAAQQKLRMVKPTPSTPRVAVKPTPQVKPLTIPDKSVSRIRRQPQTPEIRTVYVPKIVKVEVPRSQQPKQVAQPAIQQPKPLPVLPLTPPPPLPESNLEIAPPSPPNPMEEWARLAKLGSYGQVSLNKNQTVSNRTSPKQVEFAGVAKPKVTPSKPEKRTPTRTATRAVRKNPKTTILGTSAKAVLATAIYGETTKEDNENKNIYVVRLKQSLKAKDGTAALPVGSQIFTKVDSISENGLMQLEIVKIRMRENGKTVEKTVPQDALMVRGKSGKPLIANQYPNNGSSIARMDITSFALGGLGKAAELMNRTESEVVTGENGTVAVTNVNRDQNVVASIVEGGAKSVVPQISRRNQRSISQMSRKTNIWFLPPGKEVEIFVNQETQF
ncbi:MAG: TrbI/VirB10 family protein [Cyanobacteria bacterium P01_D01_bin.50]